MLVKMLAIKHDPLCPLAASLVGLDVQICWGYSGSIDCCSVTAFTFQYDNNLKSTSLFLETASTIAQSWTPVAGLESKSLGLLIISAVLSCPGQASLLAYVHAC